MTTEEFTVQNVKCGGCVKAIVDGLTAMNGIEQVDVTIDGGLVKVEGVELSRTSLSQKLTELGYPEA
ncbi:MAG: heavy-metal-associated domain-containing protein [Gammaproteobacteria bacterium]|nr:heavy-metal-associated domain-containing protein [Gammaproteobacteria bacterium]